MNSQPKKPNGSVEGDEYEKKQEIERICEDFDFPEECGDVVKFLFKASHYSATMVELCVGVTETCVEDEYPTKQNIGEIKRLISRTKASLKVVNNKPAAKLSPLRVSLPPGRRGKGIGLNFTKKRQRSTKTLAEASPRPIHQNRADRLWTRMVCDHGIESLLLLYDTPEVGMMDVHADMRGRWAGTGEVAAGFLLGQCIASLRQHLRIDVKRWRDMEWADLTEANTCLVILGSSVKNPWLKRLRDRADWKKLNFYFKTATEPGSDGCICEGPLKGKARKDPYPHRLAAGGLPEEDYALVSFFRDTYYRQTIVALQGITTVGTFAAAIQVCNDDRVRLLEDTAPFLKDREGSLPSFEVLLQVHINDCEPAFIDIKKVVIGN